VKPITAVQAEEEQEEKPQSVIAANCNRVDQA
jgi:hypothetical protein